MKYVVLNIWDFIRFIILDLYSLIDLVVEQLGIIKFKTTIWKINQLSLNLMERRVP